MAIDVDGAVDTVDDARIDRLANAVQAADRAARRLEEALAASASGGRVPKQPAAADGQPEKPSKQAALGRAHMRVRRIGQVPTELFRAESHVGTAAVRRQIIQAADDGPVATLC